MTTCEHLRTVLVKGTSGLDVTECKDCGHRSIDGVCSPLVASYLPPAALEKLRESDRQRWEELVGIPAAANRKRRAKLSDEATARFNGNGKK